MNETGRIGFYGKTEAQADFLRVNAGSFSQAGLDRWLESTLETLRGEGGQLPDAPAAFLAAPQGAPHVFVGVIAPSTDAAGRSFPLVAFAPITTPDFVVGWAPLFSACGRLVASLRDLSTKGTRLGATELSEGADACVGEARTLDAYVATAPASGLGGQESSDALRAALGGSAPALAYALSTMVLACDQAAKSGPTATAGVITIDAPVPDAASAWLWLELASRRLRWRNGLPGVLWTVDASVSPSGRLLLTLGPPSSSVLSFLANPRHRSPRFWPLRTQVTAAIDHAWQALSPEQRQLVDNPSTPVGALVTAFAA